MERYKKLLLGLVTIAVMAVLCAVCAYAEPEGVTEIDSSYFTGTGTDTSCRQISCDAVGGVYFLNGNTLSFYSLDESLFIDVYTFTKRGSILSSFTVNDKLYVNQYYYKSVDGVSVRYSYITVYNLALMKVEKIIEFEGDTSAIGADYSGRIYLAGNDCIYLLSSEGELLTTASIENSIYCFTGFDSNNGNFYYEGYYNWIYWGYDHTMSAIRAGNVSDGRITIDETPLRLVCQKYFYERSNQTEILDNKYLCIDNTFYSQLELADISSYSLSSQDGMLITFSVDRNNTEDGSFDSKAANGTRAIYRAESNSIIAFKNNAYLAEYDVMTGEELYTKQTTYPVFSLLDCRNNIVAIEKYDNKYYLEIFKWTPATSITINGSTAAMKVGTVKNLTVSNNGTLDEIITWSSDDNTIASVTQTGEVFAWKKGTTKIHAKSKNGLSAEFTITVSTESDVQSPEKPVVSIDKGTVTSNISDNNYQVWSNTVKSYLCENSDGTLTRVEYDGSNIILEIYSDDMSKLISSKTISCELDIFGGCYFGKDNNYLVFGQINENESDDAEVIRVAKYSKNWEKISCLSINGANTYIPFDAGSLRMTEVNGQLYIYTCHKMFAEDDGYHHQSNMTFVIDESTMTLSQSYYDVMNIEQAGYVSHSFNQFIKSDGESVYRVDHGDSYPRAITITKCDVDGEITDVSYIGAFPISGYSGYNATGVSIGGFELSDDNCIIVGNSVDQNSDTYSPYSTRNIFVSVTDKELKSTNNYYITNYTEDDNVTVSTPLLVKIGNNQFLLLWEETNNGKTDTNMVSIDSNGNLTSTILSTQFRLSDCMPIVMKNGLICWYTTNNSSPVFYFVNPFDLLSAHTHIYSKWTVTKSATCTQSGIMSSECACGHIKTINISATGHTYVTSIVKPTLEAEGYTLHECSVCGYNYRDNYTAKLLPPSQVTGLTYGARSADYVSLRWNKDANADGYIVEYLSTDRFVKLTDKTSGSSVSHKVTGLEPGKLYKFRIRSYRNVNGTRVYAAYSDVLKVRTLPTAMTGLTLGARTDTSISLKWDKNESANGAIVEMYSGGEWITVATKTSNSAVSHKITGLKASTAYKFRVRAYINDEEGRIYSVYNVTLNEATAPSAVTNFRNTIAARTALRFNWDKNTTADGYCIEMVQDGKWVQVTKTEGNATIAYAQLKLNPATTYRFRIRAYKQILGKTIYGAYTTISAKTAS